jgi:hypothetical protein
MAASHIFGATPMGQARRTDYFESGHLKGPRIDAQIIKGSAHALLHRFDGVIQPDVRLTLEISGGHHLFIQYRGYRHAVPEVMECIVQAQAVSPEEVYPRPAPPAEMAQGRPVECHQSDFQIRGSTKCQNSRLALGSLP